MVKQFSVNCFQLLNTYTCTKLLRSLATLGCWWGKYRSGTEKAWEVFSMRYLTWGRWSGGGTSCYYVNRALNHVMLTMSETIKKNPNVSLVFYFWVGVVRSPPVTQAAPRCKPRACANARKVELLCSRTSARNSILILQDRCRVRRSLQSQRPNNGLNCICQPAGPKIAAKKKKVRQVVRQLPAFHVLHFKHLLPDAGFCKISNAK